MPLVLRPIQCLMICAATRASRRSCKRFLPRRTLRRVHHSYELPPCNLAAGDSMHSGCKARMQFVLPLSLATRLGSRLLFLAEFLESGIAAQPIPVRVQTQLVIPVLSLCRRNLFEGTQCGVALASMGQ